MQSGSSWALASCFRRLILSCDDFWSSEQTALQYRSILNDSKCSSRTNRSPAHSLGDLRHWRSDVRGLAGLAALSAVPRLSPRLSSRPTPRRRPFAPFAAPSDSFAPPAGPRRTRSLRQAPRKLRKLRKQLLRGTDPRALRWPRAENPSCAQGTSPLRSDALVYPKPVSPGQTSAQGDPDMKSRNKKTQMLYLKYINLYNRSNSFLQVWFEHESIHRHSLSIVSIL